MSSSQEKSMMEHAPIKTMMSVKEALARLSKSEELQAYIISKREMWSTFGKMNSHLYRAILMKRMAEAALSSESQFMVFFLFSVIKNRDRVLRAMESMEPVDQAQLWFTPVRSFITTHVTQYVSDVVRSKKFPAVNIPNCNPGLDVLVYCLITDPNDRTLEDLFNRPTSSQLFLDDEAQACAKLGYKRYWDTIVNGTKNPDAAAANSKLEAPQFREEFYASSAGDKYKLVDLNLVEIDTPTEVTGYSLEKLKEYMISIDPNKEYNPRESKLEKEWLRDYVLVEPAAPPVAGPSTSTV